MAHKKNSGEVFLGSEVPQAGVKPYKGLRYGMPIPHRVIRGR